MFVYDIVEKADIGDTVYVVKPMVIRWSSMRFENTSIVYGKYIVSESNDGSLWGNQKSNYLRAIDLPKGTGNYPPELHTHNRDYQCFFSTQEAEIWKVLEIQDLEQKVDEHIIKLKEKTAKKIKTLKQKEKLDNYLEKYPEHFLKVL